MSGSYESVKSTLISALDDNSISVIALSGKWGTGKSHLWKKLGHTQKNKSKPIYVSLFGVKTINELKLRIVQNVSLNSDDKYKEYKQNTTSVLKSLAGKFLGVEVENLILLSMPTLIKDRLVVIDDLERKHVSLDINEVMGFINEYSENHKSRFLLLLNQDRLADKAIWEELHEKVIDIEIVLDPTPADAFSVATQDNQPPYIELVSKAVETLGINNIRVIRRVCRVVTKLLGKYASLDKSTAIRVVPSTALLTALHYRAIPDGPPMTYVASYNSTQNMFAKYANKEERPPEEIKWDALLQKLQINSSDEYENIVYRYLITGVIEIEKLDGLIKSYILSADESSAQVRAREFLDAYFWNHSINKNSLIKMASSLIDDKLKFINASSITSIADAVEELGDLELANKLIDAWIMNLEERVGSIEITEDSFDHFRQKINPKILGKYKELKERKYPSLSLTEAVTRLARNSGWGNREREALAQSSIEQYETIIRNLKSDDIGIFLDQHFSWPRIGGLMDDKSFAKAMANFEFACRNICFSEPNSRLCGILKREFNRNGLADKLLKPPG